MARDKGDRRKLKNLINPIPMAKEASPNLPHPSSWVLQSHLSVRVLDLRRIRGPELVLACIYLVVFYFKVLLVLVLFRLDWSVVRTFWFSPCWQKQFGLHSLIRFGLLIFNAGSTTLALDILSISLLSALLRESHGVSHYGQSDSTSPLFFPLSLWIFLVALLKKWSSYLSLLFWVALLFCWRI